MQYSKAIPVNDEEPYPNQSGFNPIMVGQVNSSAPSAPPIQPSRPKNRWADNLCDCKHNLYPSCFCTIFVCYGVWLQAQMAHKLRMINFWTIIYVFIPYWIVAFVLQIVYPATAVLSWMIFIFSLLLSLAIRSRIVSTDNINGNNQLQECCIGFWCVPCSIAQMARHMYGYKKSLDGDGDPDRPDNYGSYNDLEMV
eukprot:gene5153-5664_t